MRARAQDPFKISENEIHIAKDVTSFEALEGLVVNRLRGSFVLLSAGSLKPRLYMDGAGTLPIVFDPQRQILGVSAAAILGVDEYFERIDEDRRRRLIKRPAGETWIPGTLTAHHGVRRLLPNHFLDLITWRTHRFWPNSDTLNRTLTLQNAGEAIGEALRSFIDDVAHDQSVKVALTAGYDSRLILAAAKQSRDRIKFFTLARGHGGRDSHVARRMTASLGLQHQIKNFVRATPEEQAAWEFATGHTIKHPNLVWHPSVRGLDCDIILTGLYGETGRARLYRDDFSSIDDKKPSVDGLLERIGLPADEDVRAELDAWLNSLAGLPFSAVLDLAVPELMYNQYFRPAQFAQQAELMPFADRAIQHLFLSTPAHVQGNNALFRQSITCLWPEALEMDFNRYGDHRDTLELLRKAAQPSRLINYIRRRLGRTLRKNLY
jgi:hypothetical protein